ncbi:hypothetical protein F511_38915 [Dorcoceras hygrometricum]|uniref:Uncharacterized protein n=1 Tax=Dorcoceras hygrometricum TaxID=472368 RepID=A0A2Z7CAF5_9LAMI|nr:hypothetical protein F511_38915 [Dorcoceras hygrometricum]
MSLFDLQDICIAIGSIATLDLPMVVDLIGIYGLKGPYCTLTTTNWFLQALSVIPRGSWGDVARRSYRDPMGRSWRSVLETESIALAAALPPLYKPPPPPPCAAARLLRKIVSGQFDEENPFVLISSVLLVQADEGVSFLVVDRIGDFYRNLPRRADVIVTTVGARHKCQQASSQTDPNNKKYRHDHAHSCLQQLNPYLQYSSSSQQISPGTTDSACTTASSLVTPQQYSRDFPISQIQGLEGAKELSGSACENSLATLLLHDPSHTSTQASQLVLIERATQDKLYATGLSPNNGGNQRQFTGEGFG